MSFFLLCVGLLAMGCGCIKKTKDVFNPAVVTCISYSIAVAAAGLGVGRWHNVDDLSGATIALIVFSIVVSVVACLTIIASTRRNWCKEGQCSLNLYSVIDTKYVVIMGLYIIIIYYLYYRQINTFISSLGIEGTIFEKLNTYRSLYIINNNSATASGNGVSTVVLQLRNIVDVMVPFILFEFIREILFKGYFNIPLAVVGVVGMLASLLTTGRLLLFSYVFAGIISLLIMQKHLHKQYDIKDLLKTVVAIALIVSVFFGLNGLMKRNSDFEFLDYITFYLGSSITNLDTYMQNPVLAKSTQTFDGFFNILSKLGFPVQNPGRSVTWIEYSGNESNVFTALQRYYSDGGYITCILYMLIFTVVVTILYLQTRRDSPFWIILYSMTFYIIFDQSRDDEFYPYIFRISFPVIILALFVICRVMMKKEK